MRDPRFALLRAHGRKTDPEDVDYALSIARKVAEGPAAFEQLDAARDDIRSRRSNCWEAFHDEFIRQVCAVPERQAAWAAIFENRFVVARDELASKEMVLISEQPMFLAATDSWRDETNPFVIWDKLPDVPLFLDELEFAAQMLLRLDGARGLTALETLPFPAIMERLLAGAFVEDRDQIEQMLELAPVVFDDQGAWVDNRSVSALLVTDMITKYADAYLNAVWSSRVQQGHDSTTRAAAEHALQKAREKEIPEWFVHAFEQLLKRPDGARIAIGYLYHLSRNVLLGKGRTYDPNDGWNVFSAALNALAMVVGGSKGVFDQLRNAWDTAEQYASKKKAEDAKRRRIRRSHVQRQDDNNDEGACSLHGDGLPWVVAASRVLLTRKNHSANDVQTFWSWFVELLNRRDPGLSLVRHGSSFVDIPQQFGYLLSLLDSPRSHWQTAYKALERQRRRAMFGHRFLAESDMDFGSILLIRVALVGIVQVAAPAKDELQTAVARDWFSEVYRAARRLWLTAVLDTDRKKRDLVAACFAAMPHVFGDTLGAALGQTIPPIANEPTMLAEACAFLRANGVETQHLVALVAAVGADLETALRDAQQWSELSGDKKAFPEHLQSLARELGIDFSQPVVTPRKDLERQNLETFAAAIPWASALLARLEADGCFSVRAHLLTAEGATWVVQARLPDNLQQRFGLAPEIRLLAASGSIRGNDLRRGIELPAGAGEVDPDLVVCASPIDDLESRLQRVAGPWGQRVGWSMKDQVIEPLASVLTQQLPKVDVFAYRDPVRGRAFTGRRDEIEAMTSRLLRGAAVGAFGLRKVGKSSLLEAVARAMDPVGTARAMGKPLPIAGETEAIVVWLDIQSLVERTLERIAERLLEGLKNRLRDNGLPMEILSSNGRRSNAENGRVRLLDERAPSADPLDALANLLQAVLDSTKALSICFILDEYDLLFEGYGGEPGTAGVEKLFQLLRSYGQTTGRVSLAVIGRDPVFIRAPHINGFTNPLLGWVEPHYIGPMSDADAMQLLQRLGKRVGLMMNPTTVAFGLRWTGGHPLLLREFGASLYASARASGAAFPMDTVPLEAQAISIFLQRDMVHTICGEIEALLRMRFPDSWAILQQVATLPGAVIGSELERDPSMGGRASRVLFDFGILRGSSSAPRLPQLYREAFGRNVPISQVVQRKQAYG